MGTSTIRKLLFSVSVVIFFFLCVILIVTIPITHESSNPNNLEPKWFKQDADDSILPDQVIGVCITVNPFGNILFLSWRPINGSDLSHYKIYRSTTSRFSLNESTYIISTVNTSYIDVGLTNGITYYYRVSAVDNVQNEGMPSDEMNGTPCDSVPPAKINKVWIHRYSFGVELTWTKSMASDLTYYKVYRSAIPGFLPSSQNFIASTLSNSFIDTNLTADINYFYRISAVDDSGNEGQASDILNGDPCIPGWVDLVVWTCNLTTYAHITITFSSGGFHISDWGQLKMDGHNLWVNSEIWRLTGAAFPQAVCDVTHIYEIGHLEDDFYTFTFKAWNNYMVGIQFMVKELITPIPTGNALELTCAMSSTWANGYKIYRSTTAGFTPDLGNLIAIPCGGSYHYIDSGLVDGITYYYQVSVAGYYTSEIFLFDEVKGTPRDTTPPEQVTGVVITAVPAGNVLNLTWIPSSAPDFVNYRVYRSTMPGFTPGPANRIASPLSNYYLDSSLVDDTIYYYRISAVDEVPNEGSFSSQASGTPQDTAPPLKVTGLTINVIPAGNSLSLSWTASSAPDFIAYRVYRSMISGGPYFSIANRTTNSYTDTGLIDGTRYYYVIRAVDEVPNVGSTSDESSGVPQDTTPPPKVTGVIITIIYPNHALNLTWTASTTPDIAGYRIYRSTTPGFPPLPANNIANVTTNSYLDTRLIDGVTYYYRIRAYDEVPNLGTASDEPNYPPPSPPPQVTGLVVMNPGTGNRLQLSWDISPAPDLNYYKVYRNNTVIGTPATNSYTDTGLTDGLTYAYYIRACDEVPNEGTASTTQYGKPTDITPPEKVVNVQITVVPTGNVLSLTWNASTAADIAGYRIYRSTTSGFVPGPSNNIANVITNSYLNTGLADGITYYYRIRAYDEVPNLGTASDETSSTPQDTTPPEKVVGMSIIVITTGNTINFSWTASTAPDIAGYRVYRSMISGGPYFNIANRTINSYTDTGLIDGTRYYYVIRAVDEVPNVGPPSDESSGVPQDTTPPPSITGGSITVIYEGNQLNITWNPSPAPDLVNYKVYRSTISGFTPGPANLIATPTLNCYLDSGLSDGMTYYYKISAVDEVPNESPPTAIIITDLGPDPPPPVTGVMITVTPTGNQLNITWTKSTAPDVVNYKIYRYTVPGFPATPVYLIASTTRNYYCDTDLTDGVTYYYRITAVDGVPNEGPPSFQASGTSQDTTPPPQVTGIIITVIPTGNRLNITWTKNTAPDVVEYKVYRYTLPDFAATPFFFIASTTRNYYCDTGLTDGVTYWYRITAVDEVPNESPPSLQASGTPQDTTPPPQTTGLRINATPNVNKLSLSWDASPAPDLYGYCIYRSSPNFSWMLIDSRTVNYYNETGLVDSQTYWYKISAYDEVPNYGLNSTPVVAVLQDTMAPPKVTGVTLFIDPQGSALNISWTASMASDLAYYKIYRGIIPKFPPELKYFIATSTSNYFIDTNVMMNITYFYRITAVDTSGNEGIASDMQTYPFIFRPGSYQQVNFNVWIQNRTSYLDITILFRGFYYFSNWGEVKRNGSILIANSEIWRSRGTSTDAFDLIDSDMTLFHTFEIGYLETGYYTFFFKAWGQEVKNVLFYVRNNITYISPQQVRGVKIINEGTGTILNISWNFNSEPGINYKIYRSTLANFSNSPNNLIASIGTNFYQDTELIEYQTYYYHVTAVDRNGYEGPPSDISSGIPLDIKPPAAPTINGFLSSRDVIIFVTPPLDTDVCFFKLYRARQSGGPYEFLGIYDFTANPIVIIVRNDWNDNLQDLPVIPDNLNTTQLPNISLNYYYVVTAVDEKFQESQFSNEIYLGLPPLSPPAWLRIIDNGNGDLQITWNISNSCPNVIGYRIYRKNALETSPTLIATISGGTINSYNDYGVPNGNWTYYITSQDIYGRESSFSEPNLIRINDIVAPGPPTNLRYEINGLNLTLIWDYPLASNCGADIFCYRIYILTKNSNNFTELMLCGTIFGRLNTRFCLNSPDRNLYYFSVVAYDENNYGSAPANFTLSLGNSVSWILPIIEISDNGQIEICIRLQNCTWIYQIQMKYTLNGGISHIIYMTCTDSFSNQTLVLKGIIPSQAPGTVINFTFLISDGWGNSVVTPYYSFRVPSDKINPDPWPIGISIFIIGAICAASLYTISSVRKYRTEREIKSLLEKVIKSPITPNFVDLDVLQENKSLECERENRAQQPIELVEIESPQYEMQNWEQQSPELIEMESIEYEEQKTEQKADQLNQNDALNNKSLHIITDQFEEFKPVILFKIFNAFQKAFPLLRHAFAEENKIMYILELNSLSREEQFAFFKNLITRNSEIEIRLQLNNLMVELNNTELNDPWDVLLPKLNTCIDLAQIIDDREFLTDVFLLIVLIQSSFG